MPCPIFVANETVACVRAQLGGFDATELDRLVNVTGYRSIIPQTFQRTAVTIVLDEDISRQGLKILTLHPLHPQAANIASFLIPILIFSKIVDQIWGH